MSTKYQYSTNGDGAQGVADGNGHSNGDGKGRGGGSHAHGAKEGLRPGAGPYDRHHR
jgi:hypothetical protein